MASDSLNEIGKFMKKANKTADLALKKNAHVYPQIERSRDIFDATVPFEMVFEVDSASSKIILDLYFNKPPPASVTDCGHGTGLVDTFERFCGTTTYFDTFNRSTTDTLGTSTFGYAYQYPFGTGTGYGADGVVFYNTNSSNTQFTNADGTAPWATDNAYILSSRFKFTGAVPNFPEAYRISLDFVEIFLIEVSSNPAFGFIRLLSNDANLVVKTDWVADAWYIVEVVTRPNSSDSRMRVYQEGTTVPDWQIHLSSSIPIFTGSRFEMSVTGVVSRSEIDYVAFNVAVACPDGWGNTDTGQTWVLEPANDASRFVELSLDGEEGSYFAHAYLGFGDPEPSYPTVYYDTPITTYLGYFESRVLGLPGSGPYQSTIVYSFGSDFVYIIRTPGFYYWEIWLQPAFQSPLLLALNTVDPTLPFAVRMESNDTVIRAKVWQLTDIEPDWQAEADRVGMYTSDKFLIGGSGPYVGSFEVILDNLVIDTGDNPKNNCNEAGEKVYPEGCRVFIDGQDITSWVFGTPTVTPTDLEKNWRNIDISQFIKGAGKHTITVTSTTGMGRVEARVKIS